jgi:cytochrome c55X
MRRLFEISAVLALSVQPALAGQLDKARINELSYLVRQDCGSCHGMTLKGGLGKSLRPADLSDWDSSQLVAIILDGVPGTPMPPWRGLISEDDARWIANALKRGLIK